MAVLQLCGANVVSFQLVLGGHQCYTAGCYLDPDDTSTIEDIVAAIRQCPQGAALLVVGDFNTNLADPEGQARDKEISLAMVVVVIE